MNKFFESEPRREVDVRIACHASEELFQPWDDMLKSAQKEFTKNGSIPCEGGGVPGTWCEQCRFGVLALPEEV